MKKLLTIVAGCILLIALPGCECFKRCKPYPTPKCPPAPCQKQNCPSKKTVATDTQSVKKTKKPATTVKKTVRKPAKPANGNGANTAQPTKQINGNGKPANAPKAMNGNGMKKDMKNMMPMMPATESAK